jgi:hypothetical protein
LVNQAVSVENSFVKLNFDNDGVLQEWIDKQSGKTFKFQQAFHYYNGVGRNGTEQRSGAYIFRPNGTLPADNFEKPTRVEVIKGKTFEEVRQIISPWVLFRSNLNRFCLDQPNNSRSKRQSVRRI